MSTSEIMQQCNQIFIDLLGNNSIVLKPETTANDVEEWDSLSHIQLMIAIEKHFKIRFTIAEMAGAKNVKELCDIIARKIK